MIPRNLAHSQLHRVLSKREAHRHDPHPHGRVVVRELHRYDFHADFFQFGFEFFGLFEFYDRHVEMRADGSHARRPRTGGIDLEDINQIIDKNNKPGPRTAVLVMILLLKPYVQSVFISIAKMNIRKNGSCPYT